MGMTMAPDEIFVTVKVAVVMENSETVKGNGVVAVIEMRWANAVIGKNKIKRKIILNFT
jgi:hypothetical protein